MRIRSVDESEAARLQESHGGWNDTMSTMLGTEGRVERAWGDGGKLKHHSTGAELID